MNMEFEGTIIEQLDTQTGTNQVTGQQWKRVTYVAQSETMSQSTIVFDVWDGRDGRIERLNLQVGKRYRLNFDFSARKNRDGKWFNSISAWGARLVDDLNAEANGELQVQ